VKVARLPKSLIKKYGISKRAWAEFRKGKTRKKSSGGYKVAKKKAKGRKRSSGNSMMSRVGKILGGAILAGVYEVFVSPMIPLRRNIKNVIEGLIGLALAVSRRVPTMVRSFGVALATINVFELAIPMIRGIGGGRAPASVGNVDAFLQ